MATTAYEFVKTFKSLNKMENINKCIKMNQEYIKMAKNSKIKTFYHGINYLSLFDLFINTFNAPLFTLS